MSEGHNASKSSSHGQFGALWFFCEGLFPVEIGVVLHQQCYVIILSNFVVWSKLS